MIRAFSHREFLLCNLVDRIRASVEVGRNSSMIVQYQLGQLIRTILRELAYSEGEDSPSNGILLQAIEIAKSEIEERAGEASLHFDFGWDTLRQKHQFPAKEITWLREQLHRARQGEVVHPPRLRVSYTEVPFRMMDLGSRGSLEGVFVGPLVDECNLNLDDIRQEYQVQGDWFPFQITVRLDGADITCILIEDGSLLTFLAGYPSGLVEQSRSAIERLARLLYVAPTS